jgi:hypothetical protein
MRNDKTRRKDRAVVLIMVLFILAAAAMAALLIADHFSGLSADFSNRWGTH